MFMIVANFSGVEYYWSQAFQNWTRCRGDGTVFTNMNAAKLERRYAETYGRAKAEVRYTQHDQ